MAKFFRSIKHMRIQFSILFYVVAILMIVMFLTTMIASFNLRMTLSKEVLRVKTNAISTIQNGIEVMFNEQGRACMALAVSETTTRFENVYYDTIFGSKDLTDKEFELLYERNYLIRRRELVNLMASFATTNQNVHSVYYYNEDDGIVITSKGVEYPVENFYDKEFMDKVENPIYPTRMESRLIGKTNSETQKYVITFIILANESRNYFIVNIDQEKFVIDVMNKFVLSSPDSDFYICRNDGMINVSSDFESVYQPMVGFADAKKNLNDGNGYMINDKKMILISYSDKLANYVLVSEDIGDITGNTLYFDKGFYYIIISIFLLSIFLYGILTQKIYLPIKKLVQKISKGNYCDWEEKSGEIDFLDKAYSRIQTDYTLLEKEMAVQAPLVKSAIVNSILFSDRKSKEKTENLVLALNPDFELDNVTIVVFESKPCVNNDINDKYIGYYKTIEAITLLLVPLYHLFYSTIENYIVVVFGSGDYNAILHSVESVVSMVSKDGEISLAAGINSEKINIVDAAEAYQEAKTALLYKVIYGKNAVISTKNINLAGKSQYRYPVEMEKQLLKYLIAGDKEKANSVVDEIIKGIMDPKNLLNVMQIRQFLFVLFSDLIKQFNSLGILIDEIFASDVILYETLLYANTEQEVTNIFYPLIDKILNHLSINGEKCNNVNMEQIFGFIEKMYVKDISLEDTAEYIGLNPSYVSRLIKKETGQTYSQFLTNVRLRHAKEMLSGTDLKIEEISLLIGYSSTNYFNRIFKENLGCTPGEYRKNFKAR